MTAYYNEYDADCVAALRLEMSRGRIPEGTIDDRSIEQVASADVAGYRHCHFFAGAGGSALACDLAGWPIDRELWCGGFPCTGISAAGKGKGLEDQQSRLWWAWLGIIAARRPLRVLIENSPMLRTRGYDRVAASLEGIGYTCRPFVVGAKHAGSPQKRLRVWIVCRLADTDLQRRGRENALLRRDASERRGSDSPEVAWGCEQSRLADCDGAGLEVGREQHARHQREAAERSGTHRWPAPRLIDADGNTLPSPQYEWEPPRSLERRLGRGVDGLSVRLGRRRNKARIKQLGNAWCPQVAAAVLRAWMVAEDQEASGAES